MKRFIFLLEPNSGNLIFNDFYLVENMEVYERIVNITNPILRFFFKLHNSRKINRKVPLPFRSIWKKYYILENLQLNSKDEYFIGFTNASVIKFPKEYLQRINEKNNIKLFLVCLDPDKDKLLFPDDYIKSINFYKVFCFDRITAEKYNLTFCMDYYSKIPIENDSIKYDVIFVGRGKNRKKLLIELYNYFMRNNEKVFYKILDPVSANQEPFIDNKIPYKNVVELTSQSNCILEVVDDGQTGRTLRYYEAICYNKKLLTNNKEIFNLPYYNPQYMRYFEKIEDIDVNWIKNRDKVDYGYAGEFSPKEMLKLL